MAFCEVPQDHAAGAAAASGDFGILTQYQSETCQSAELVHKPPCHDGYHWYDLRKD
jgi:hypothetical protein